jgi:hypothetical protein
LIFLSQQSNLASLLKTAEELRIKGLAEVSWRDDENENAESNDNNNNNVSESNTSFPLLAQTSSSSTTSSSTHHLQSNHQQQSQVEPSGNGSDRKEYDKENMLKAIPFLAPLSSPKDLSSSASRKKRGRPPLDDSNSFTKT